MLHRKKCSLSEQHVRVQNTLKLDKAQWEMSLISVMSLRTGKVLPCLMIELIYSLYEGNNPTLSLQRLRCIDVKHIPTSQRLWLSDLKQMWQNTQKTSCTEPVVPGLVDCLKHLHEWVAEVPWKWGRFSPAKETHSYIKQLLQDTACPICVSTQPVWFLMTSRLCSRSELAPAAVPCSFDVDVCVLHDYRRSNQSAPRNLSNSRVPRKGL